MVLPSGLRNILCRGYESKDLDYKHPMAWDEADKSSCCGLVKDILAMANTRGGFISIGVSQQPLGYSFDGVSPDQAKTFDTTRLNCFLQAYADPAKLAGAGMYGKCSAQGAVRRPGTRAAT